MTRGGSERTIIEVGQRNVVSSLRSFVSCTGYQTLFSMPVSKDQLGVVACLSRVMEGYRKSTRNRYFIHLKNWSGLKGDDLEIVNWACVVNLDYQLDIN